MKGSHKTQTCMPLKPVTIRDCEGVVQFNAATTGIFTMPIRAADSWFSHLALEVPGENCSNEWLEAVSDAEYSKLS